MRTWAAVAAGLALGITLMVSAALLLYTGQGLLASAGFLVALALLSIAAGVWVGAPEGPQPPGRRLIGRWMLAVASVVVASFIASAWLRVSAFRSAALGGPLAVVLLLAEPAYAIAALLGALEARRRDRRSAPRARVAEGRPGGGIVVPSLLGTAAGVALAAIVLIPSLPPGPILLGTGILLAAAGTIEMTRSHEPTEDAMAEQVVVVTGVGGAAQVGAAIGSAFRARGASVLVTGRSREEVEARARDLGGDTLAVGADLTTAEGAAAVVDAARSRWGRIDVLVNVAGGLRVTKTLAETSPEEWQAEQDRNARTAFLMSRAALPLLRESRGAIVNFASPAGERAVGGLGAYSAAKAGVVALTRSMALEEREHGVRVNAVAPGMVDTADNRRAVEAPESVKWVTREQVAEVVVFLASPDGAGVNGEVVRVEGAGVR